MKCSICGEPAVVVCFERELKDGEWVDTGYEMPECERHDGTRFWQNERKIIGVNGKTYTFGHGALETIA